jgi:hypothetical protein
MSEALQELVDSRGVTLRVDAAAGVLRGVKILGLESRNGRVYLPAALAQAAPLYEGAKVNVNHPLGHPAGPRDYRDRLGSIRRVAVRAGQGLFGDLHFNPKHAVAEQLVWDALHAPENVGFSHNVEARTARRGDRTVVEAILRVQSVDLVADPATTRGLFEGAAESVDPPEPQGGTLAALTLDALRTARPDLVEMLLERPTARCAALEVEIDRLRAAEALAERQRLVRRVLLEHRLPDPDAVDAAGRAIAGEEFLRTLLAAADEPAVRRLVAERARLVEAVLERTAAPLGKPLAREQQTVADLRPAVRDAAEFVRAIT